MPDVVARSSRDRAHGDELADLGPWIDALGRTADELLAGRATTEALAEWRALAGIHPAGGPG